MALDLRVPRVSCLLTSYLLVHVPVLELVGYSLLATLLESLDRSSFGFGRTFLVYVILLVRVRFDFCRRCTSNDDLHQPLTDYTNHKSSTSVHPLQTHHLRQQTLL